MPNYRRAFVPGGSFFFTVVNQGRYPLWSQPSARRVLREVMRECLEKWPFRIDAIVLVPDHLHAIWSLPPGDTAYPKRWGWIKKEFTKRWISGGGRHQRVSAGRRMKRERGVWQRRYWEHALESEDDFENHFDYAHYNPVKHGWARCPSEWKWSTFHRWVKAGVYPHDWACSARSPLDVSRFPTVAGEFDP